jgi:four helix bundle protein
MIVLILNPQSEINNGFFMNADILKRRTMLLGIEAIKFAESLPESSTARIIRNQLIRCGTSVGANYRASCRAKSPADFIAKMGIVEEETDEVLYWLELLTEIGLVSPEKTGQLSKEANEILAIVVASIKTAKLSKITPDRNNPQSAFRNPKL